jgi:hypothetical protein
LAPAGQIGLTRRRRFVALTAILLAAILAVHSGRAGGAISPALNSNAETLINLMGLLFDKAIAHLWTPLATTPLRMGALIC